METASVTFTSGETGAEAPAKTPEQAAADAAAIARAQQHAPAPHEQGRPDWLPSQFASVTDFVKSADETKAALTRAQQELATAKKGQQTPTAPAEPGAEQPGQQQTEQPPADQTEAAKAVVAKAGLDVSPWQSEFDTTGDVSEAGRAKIAEALAGQFGDQARSLVDKYIDGQIASRSNYEGAVHQMAGGKEQYGEMMAWAKTSLTDAEKATFNKSVNSFDLTAAQMAVEGLKARFTRERGSAPDLITGENNIAGGNTGFASTYDMTQAMSDPRYGKDPVYTKQVEQRAMRSNF